MKIALIGYGKMGKAVETAAAKHGHNITLTIDNEAEWIEKAEKLNDCDVAIEFSLPNLAPQNILNCFKYNIPVVTGTTAWFDRLDEIKSYCIEHNQTLFYAANFSLGVNIFLELNKYLAKTMNNFEDYEVYMEEEHDATKKDTPSGTAVMLANDLVENLDRKHRWDKEKMSEKEILNIESYREENVFPMHNIIYESDVDLIEIKHTAKSRMGFAFGAIKAAEWVVGKKGVFTMKDLMDINN